MIIDLILDRKDGHKYDPKEFYLEVKDYYTCAGHSMVQEITGAMDSGYENEVKAALIHYVLKNDYNPAICGYILSVNWL